MHKDDELTSKKSLAFVNMKEFIEIQKINNLEVDIVLKAL